MIERYSITSPADSLHQRFAVDVTEFYKPKFNAAPAQLLPVITSQSPQGISFFYWGETPARAKNKTPGEKLINVRVEHLIEKTSLRKTMLKARCLIPADGFYGWKKVGKKTNIPYRFVLNSNGIFSFPALWEEYEDDDGSATQTFSILTTAATAMTSQIQDRMPVIFDEEKEHVWLNHETPESELMELLKPYQPNDLNYYPVSPRINDSKIDVPSLITATPPSDQHGNLTLFD